MLVEKNKSEIISIGAIPQNDVDMLFIKFFFHPRARPEENGHAAVSMTIRTRPEELPILPVLTTALATYLIQNQDFGRRKI